MELNHVVRFVSACRKAGFSYSVRGGVISLARQIECGNVSAFEDVEQAAYEALYHVPTSRTGTVWGSDGCSIGGQIAIDTGRFEMNKSGVSKRFLQKLGKVSKWEM